MSSISDPRQRLEAALAVGQVLVATVEQPSPDGPSIGLTATIRRGARLEYLLILDWYRMDPPFGTDLDRQLLSFDALAPLWDQVVASGLALSEFRVLRSPLASAAEREFQEAQARLAERDGALGREPDH
jgi:hypothetical protein